MAFKSLQFRLHIWFGLLLILLVVGLGLTQYQLQRLSIRRQVDRRLEAKLNVLLDTIWQVEHRSDSDMLFGLFRRPPPPGPPPWLHEQHEQTFSRPPPPVFIPHEPIFSKLPRDTQQSFEDESRYLFAILSPDGEVQELSSPKAAVFQVPPHDDTTLVRYTNIGPWRQISYYMQTGACIWVAVNIEEHIAYLRNFGHLVFWIGLLILVISIGGGHLSVYLSLRSIRRIGETAEHIAEGHLSERVPTQDMDRELKKLADVLNRTFERLDTVFTRQKQFTADAAHELRTPLAVILSETQTALRRERTPEEYIETIQVCEEAAQNMRKLSESLLELSRLDAHADTSHMENADPAMILQAAIEVLKPLSEEQQVHIFVDTAPVMIRCYPEQITRVFINIISNALNYSRPGGSVRITVRPQPNHVVITVSDTGAGISAEALPHIFERFYRASSSRTRDGHVGLGLAISKAIVEGHDGTIQAESKSGQGTTMIITLPRLPPPPTA